MLRQFFTDRFTNSICFPNRWRRSTYRTRTMLTYCAAICLELHKLTFDLPSFELKIGVHVTLGNVHTSFGFLCDFFYIGAGRRDRWTARLLLQHDDVHNPHSTVPRLSQQFCTSVQQRSGSDSSLLSDQHQLFSSRTKFGDRAFSVAGPVVWNSIPAAVCDADTVSSFKRKLKTHFFLRALTMFDFY